MTASPYAIAIAGSQGGVVSEVGKEIGEEVEKLGIYSAPLIDLYVCIGASAQRSSQ